MSRLIKNWALYLVAVVLLSISFASMGSAFKDPWIGTYVTKESAIPDI